MADKTVNTIEYRIGQKGHSRIQTTVTMGGDTLTFVFREGGQLSAPGGTTAIAGRGMASDGLFDPWTQEGQVTLNDELMDFFNHAYKELNFHYETSAVVEYYSVISNMSSIYYFQNVRVGKIPIPDIPSLGAESLLPVTISLNDYMGYKKKIHNRVRAR